MNTLKSAMFLPLLALSCLAPALPAHAEASHTHSAPSIEARTDNALRDLWVGHAFWVRNVVQSSLAGNKAAASAAEQQVVANARAIATAIEPFYGKEAASKLFSLLAGHYGAVKQYLEATVARSAPAQDAATKTLTANADEIARFLSGANPNLPYDTLRGLLLAHGGHHLTQIQELQAGRYADEAQTWEAMKNHMYVVADALTAALAKQFPDKFLAVAN